MMVSGSVALKSPALYMEVTVLMRSVSPWAVLGPKSCVSGVVSAMVVPSNPSGSRYSLSAAAR